MPMRGMLTNQIPDLSASARASKPDRCSVAKPLRGRYPPSAISAASFPVFPDRFDRASLHCLTAKGGVLFGLRLGVNEGKSALVAPRETVRRSFAAEIAIDALLINVEFSSCVVRPFVSFVRHR